MFVVLFEVQPHAQRWDDYLAVAGLLRPELQAIEGFLDNTRFASARTRGRLVSVSTWRDEKSLIRWRAHALHHELGQRRGRAEIFRDYRLRVGEVTDDTHPPAGVSAQQTRYDETEVAPAKAVSVIELAGPAATGTLPDLTGGAGLVDVERYDALLEPHTPLLLASWVNLQAARAGVPALPGLRVRHVSVVREYGLHERREAPQYLPAAPRGQCPYVEETTSGSSSRTPGSPASAV